MLFAPRVSSTSFLGKFAGKFRLPRSVGFADVMDAVKVHFPIGTIAGDSGAPIGVWRVRPDEDEKRVLSWTLRQDGELRHFRAPFLTRPGDDIAPEIRSRTATTRPVDDITDGEPAEHFRIFGFYGSLRVEGSEIARHAARLVRFPRQMYKDEIATCALYLRAPIEAFLLTMDAELIDYVRYGGPTSDALRDTACWHPDVWSGLDDTFTPHTPLKRAILDHPHLTNLLADFWVTNRRMFMDLTKSGTNSTAVAAFVRAKNISPALASRLSADSDNLMRSYYAMNSSRFVLPEFTRIFDTLSDLPLDWIPQGLPEWTSFMCVAPAICLGKSHLMVDICFADFVNSKGRWADLSSRLLAASTPNERGVVPRQRMASLTNHLCHRVADVQGMLQKFKDDVCDPACRLSGHLPVDNQATRRLLLGRKSLAKCLELSRDWHVRLGAMNAAIGALSPPSADPGWPAGLPNWSRDEFEIKVLTNQTELSDEGAYGPTSDGQAGLSHCVGGYASTCRSGRSRILSIRRHLPEGGFVRLSTAQIEIGQTRHRVRQLRGRSNGPPGADSERLLNLYLKQIANGVLSVDPTAFVPIPDPIRHTYDFCVPGAWEAIYALWNSFLPKPARGWSVEQMSEFVRAPTSQEPYVKC